MNSSIISFCDSLPESDRWLFLSGPARPFEISTSSTSCLKYVIVMAYFSVLDFLSRECSGCFSKGNPRNALVWFLAGSTFRLHCFWVVRFTACVSTSMTHVLFQLPTFSSVLNLLLTMGTTPLVKSPILCIVFCRR